MSFFLRDWRAALLALAQLPDGVERRSTGDVERMRELFGGFVFGSSGGVE